MIPDSATESTAARLGRARRLIGEALDILAEASALMDEDHQLWDAIGHVEDAKDAIGRMLAESMKDAKD